jgi:galactitol-specific phosphotransferase system IIB component
MNTSENIVMNIDSEITKNEVSLLTSDLCQRGEFDRVATEYNLIFTKSKLDDFFTEDIIGTMIQGMKDEQLRSKVDLEGYIIAFFFEYQRVKVKNRVIELVEKLYESRIFKQFASENDLSFSLDKLNEFLKSYTYDEMITKIQKNSQIYEGENGDKLLGDYIVSSFFEYRRSQIENRVLFMLTKFCNLGVFHKIAHEHNLIFIKSRLDEFISANIDEMIQALQMEKDSVYEGEDGDKLLEEYIISVCVENVMITL